MRRLAVVVLWLGVLALPAGAETWPEAMQAARAEYQAWWNQAPGIQVDKWYESERLRADSMADKHSVEDTVQAVQLDAKRKDGQVVWTPRWDMFDGVSHHIANDGKSIRYFYRNLAAGPADIAFEAQITGADGLKVWLNGAEVFAREPGGHGRSQADAVTLPLKKGDNALVVKVFLDSSSEFRFMRPGDPTAAIAARLDKAFPQESGWLRQDLSRNGHLGWLSTGDPLWYERDVAGKLHGQLGDAKAAFAQELEALSAAKTPADSPKWFELYAQSRGFLNLWNGLQRIDVAALRRANDDLAKSYPDQYRGGAELEARLDDLEKDWPPLLVGVKQLDAESLKKADAALALQRTILMGNPLLDFRELLLVKRDQFNLGLPQNWQGNCAVEKDAYDNEVALLSLVSPGALKTVYRPEGGKFVGNLYLHFDGRKMLFSMPGSHDRWQIWEMNADGQGLRQMTPGTEDDVDNYDACYLPDERIIFASTRCFQGVPCVGGANTVANLCLMNPDGTGIRQLCFDQDHNWCPTLLNNGRVLYSRWEYSDTPHYFSRLLFSMNPDGTNQAAYYGSNSYWPNSMFYSRAIPGDPSKIVTIVSGHHGVPRMGEMVLLDPEKGRTEGAGVVQRIPGYGKKVEPVIEDQLVDTSWPKFLHPCPLSDKYFIVSCKPSVSSPWGIYLVDVFDNMLLLAETPGYALFEPVPLRKTERPPVIPDKVKLDKPEATVYLADIYAGPGLKGVPRGSVKSLRLYEFHYAYPRIGGHVEVGVEGPWDVRRILGTVPVYEDGSASFKIPANTPIAVQPLDAEGRALQLMRSWFVGMPGEMVSCVGCHERQNMAPSSAPSYAAQGAPVDITPWRGPARGYSFKHDVQPALDKYCVGCHDGTANADGQAHLDLRPGVTHTGAGFDTAYLALHPYVRRPGPESDYHMLAPLEYHTSTSELIQMLQKGHYGVRLDDEAWDRLNTWIDLNVPDHGSWREIGRGVPNQFDDRRRQMLTCYAMRPEDPEAAPEPNAPVAFVTPEPEPARPRKARKCSGWPLTAKKSVALQQAAGKETAQTVELGNGVTMKLALIPSGQFAMGSIDGAADEMPQSVAKVDRAFWMGSTEVTNQQFAQFDPKHDSGVIDQHSKDHTRPGYPAQDPDMPVIRVTWDEAVTFCNWLSEKTGKTFSLPTEAQWEWACRAGTNAPFWYGGPDTDFAAYANLGDASLKLMAVTGIDPQPIKNPSKYEDFLPKDARFDDGEKIVARVGKYQPSGWGLYDMHGNVAEWTLTSYRAYPYLDNDGRNDAASPEKKVARGGSWYDRPKRATASYRVAYERWQPVYNVGFRVVCVAE